MNVLYKYMPPARTDVLRDGRIRYTQPMVFNDPFESKPHVASMPARELMERVSKSESERMQLSDQERRAILKAAEDPEHYAKVEAAMMMMMGTMVGVLSLTEKCSNLLMWAHYAAEHTGFVIGFDTTHGYWNNFGDEKGNDHVGVLRKVDYSEKRPSIAHLAKMTLAETYFAKSIEWEYEQEWRVFRGMERADHIIELSDDAPPICLFNFPKESVSEIVLGCRSTEALHNAVVGILRSSPEYAKTTLMRAEIDEAEFKLNFKPL